MSIGMQNRKVVQFYCPASFVSVSSLVCYDPGKFLPTRRTPGVSTSDLLERIVSGYRKKEFDQKLVKMGHSELKAEGSDFEDSPAGSRAQSRSRGRKLPAAMP